MMVEQRLSAVRGRMKQEGWEAVLVTDTKNRHYLCGFSGSSGWLLVTEEQHYILTDGRYWDQVARECPTATLVRFVPSEHTDLAGALRDTAARLSISAGLAVELDNMPLILFRGVTERLTEAEIQYQECENLVASLRAVKDEEEIARLARAAEIADRSLSNALKEFGPGCSERDLKAALEFQILQNGGDGSSFPTIVASGPNGSYPHAGASSRKVQEGELITIDFGALYQGYCSDMTRTIWYGALSERQTEILTRTREAQALALGAVRAGLPACELDKVARDHLEAHSLGEYFVHSLGHGVGMDVHESPGIRKTNRELLKTGQVITIEPGVYIPGETGCRVEDTVVVTDTGCRVLNRFPKQPLGSSQPGLLE